MEDEASNLWIGTNGAVLFIMTVLKKNIPAVPAQPT
ncbi:hypothetical protein [Paraflavitalea speifideaquila]